MIADRLRAAILQAAISGKLTDRRPEDGTATELLETIKTERQQLEKEGKLKKQKPLPPVDKTDEPFDLPDSWVWSRLGRVFNMQAGKNVAVGNISEVGEYPCYGGNGIRGYVADYNRDGTYPIIGRQGALCGNINVASGRFFATEHAVVVETFGHTSPAWAALALEQLNLNQYATATAQPGLSVEKLKVVPVPVPPVDEQERIVAKLDEILPLIDQLAELESDREYLDHKFAKAIERAILQAAISGRLTDQRPEDGTAEELLEQIVAERVALVKKKKIKNQKLLPRVNADDQAFVLPASWSWISFGETISLLSGRDLTPDQYSDKPDGIPYITGASNFANGSIIVNRWTAQPLTVAHQGDLLITCKGTIGDLAVLEEPEAHIARQVMAITCLQVRRGYIAAFLEYSVAALKAQAKSMIPGISRDMLLKTPLPLPPLAEQERIVAKLDEILPLVDELAELERESERL